MGGMSSVRSSKRIRVIASLFAWYDEHGRHSLPWRQTRDPYRILISELMLQQTQVARVRPKYEAFTDAFPTIESLANAARMDVLQHWQGLGYNSRAVRLHALARLITERSGTLPETYEELLKLPGIGPYTAGAIIIFSQRKPAASIDVNVERVLKRVFFPPAESPARQQLAALQLQLITESRQPHHWHAALMDLGSALCTARSPKCGSCPLVKMCSTRGVRPDELRTTPKQSAFLGSTRWWRGQILKQLLVRPLPERHLLHRIKQQPDAEDEERYGVALAALIAEGIVTRTGKNVRVS